MKWWLPDPVPSPRKRGMHLWPAAVIGAIMLSLAPVAHAQRIVEPNSPCEQAGLDAEREYALPAGLLSAIGRVESGRWDAALRASHRLAVCDRCGGTASRHGQQGYGTAADPRVAAERPAQHRCRLLPDQPAEPSDRHSPIWTRHSIRRPMRSTPHASCHRCTRSWAVGRTPSRRIIPRRRRSAFLIGSSCMPTGQRPRAGSTLWPPDPIFRCRREKSQMRSRFSRLTATRCVSGHRARPAGPPRSSRSPAPRQRHCRISLRQQVGGFLQLVGRRAINPRRPALP